MAVFREKILLVGVKHCGKSSAGRRLAANLHRIFVDCDAEMEARDAVRNGGVKRTAREIFRAVGEEEFRRLEAEALLGILDRQEELVVAAGGGLCENRELAWQEVRSKAKIVFLDAPDEVLWQRISRKGELPAYLSGTPEEAQARLREINSRRRAVYNAEAHISVKAAENSEATAQRIIRLCRD